LDSADRRSARGTDREHQSEGDNGLVVLSHGRRRSCSEATENPVTRIYAEKDPRFNRGWKIRIIRGWFLFQRVISQFPSRTLRQYSHPRLCASARRLRSEERRVGKEWRSRW